VRRQILVLSLADALVLLRNILHFHRPIIFRIFVDQIRLRFRNFANRTGQNSVCDEGIMYLSALTVLLAIFAHSGYTL